MMENLLIETHPFEPFVPDHAKVLVLGSFPPPENRWAMKFYYPNRTNDFWKVCGIVFFNDKDRFFDLRSGAFKLEEIKDFLQQYRIAMYDAGKAVRRLKANASDKFLEIVEPVSVCGFLDRCPALEMLVTTGEKASQVVAGQTGTELPKMGEYVEFLNGSRTIRHYRMPSTSRAYPMAVEKKAEIYSRVFRLLGPCSGIE